MQPFCCCSLPFSLCATNARSRERRESLGAVAAAAAVDVVGLHYAITCYYIGGGEERGGLSPPSFPSSFPLCSLGYRFSPL